MSDRAPYSRVYWIIRSDERLADIYPCDANLAAWLRLLIAADMAWPAPADLPRNVKASAVAALEAAGVIQQLPGGLFIFHGLDAERSRRGTGRAATGTQAGPKPDPSGSEVGPSRARAPRLVSSSLVSSPAREGLPNLNSAVASLWENATGRSVIASGAYAAEYLDDACRRHPPSEVGAAIVRARKGFDHIPDAAQLVSAMRPILDPLPDRKKASADEREREERAASRRRTAATLEGIHRNGGHEAEPRAGCPMCEAVTA